MEVDLLSVALTKAITDAVPTEMQKEIFTKALYEHLFRKSRHDGTGPTPIQEAFQRALNEATSAMAQKMFTQPEYIAQVEQALRDAFAEIVKDGQLAKKFVDKISSSLRW